MFFNVGSIEFEGVNSLIFVYVCFVLYLCRDRVLDLTVSDT